LEGLPNGLHILTVYANDTYGNMGASETVTFNVAVPEPFPVVPVVIAIVAITAVAAGLFFFKKRRKEAAKTCRKQPQPSSWHSNHSGSRNTSHQIGEGKPVQPSSVQRNNRSTLQTHNNNFISRKQYKPQNNQFDNYSKRNHCKDNG